jgi:hypothetical protein
MLNIGSPPYPYLPHMLFVWLKSLDGRKVLIVDKVMVENTIYWFIVKEKKNTAKWLVDLSEQGVNLFQKESRQNWRLPVNYDTTSM